MCSQNFTPLGWVLKSRENISIKKLGVINSVYTICAHKILLRESSPLENGQFSSCLLSLCQNEFKCETIHMKMGFRIQVHFHANQSHFHKNGFTLRLVLTQRQKATRK